MPDTFTPVLNLTKPEVGASRDSWGSKTNLNWDTLDQFVSQAMPIGSILDYAGTTPPSGWMVADGRLISRVTYSNLFAVLGTTWGAGDGSTTFALPSLNGRSTVGPGTVIDQIGTSTTFTLAQQFGMVYNYIAQTHLPAYNLITDTQGLHSHGGASQAAGAGTYGTDGQGNHSHTGATAGENATHYHTALTDLQGSHQHSYTTIAMTGNFVSGGAATQVSPAGALTSVDGGHQHNITTSTESNAHAHAIAVDGFHAHNVSISAHAHTISADGWHQHNVNLGGGGNPFEVMSPILVVTKIIYAGQQASTRTALDAAAPVSLAATDSTDEMAAIREELAALRALFAPAARRVPTTPLRGMN